MEITLEAPINFFPTPNSPEAEAGREAIRMAVGGVSFDAGRVQLTASAHAQIPLSVGRRYRRLKDAFVLVVNDVEHADGGVLLLKNDFIEYARGEDGPNQIEEPELPMPGRGSLSSEGFQGVWLTFTVSFPCATAIPRYRPSAYLYLVLENHVSNVVGLDLIDKKAVSF